MKSKILKLFLISLMLLSTNLFANSSSENYLFPSIIFFFNIFLTIHFLCSIPFYYKVIGSDAKAALNTVPILAILIYVFYDFDISYMPFFLENNHGAYVLTVMFLCSYPFIHHFFLKKKLISINFKKCLCLDCYCFSNHIKNNISWGVRGCDKCGNHVYKNKKTLILIFGSVDLYTSNPIDHVLLENYDFSQMDYVSNIEAIYINTENYNKDILEKFLTYTTSHPPHGGIKNIPVFYQGSLENLGKNIINVFRNNFKSLEKVEAK